MTLKASGVRHDGFHAEGNCNCVCSHCFLVWSVESGGRVGICICPDCKCSQALMAERIQSRLVHERLR